MPSPTPRIALVTGANKGIGLEISRQVARAGITGRQDGPPGKASLDAVRRVFDTNFFGALAVTQAMLPLLRKSASGRIVNVSSGLGSLTHNSDPAWESCPKAPRRRCAWHCCQTTGRPAASSAPMRRSPGSRAPAAARFSAAGSGCRSPRRRP
jgi:NAD(P)-dependent dehydrogenase (short-subunit alcohol dehydrogenase family)